MLVDTVSACGVKMFFDNVLSLLNSYVCWLCIYVYFVCSAFTCRHFGFEYWMFDQIAKIVDFLPVDWLFTLILQTCHFCPFRCPYSTVSKTTTKLIVLSINSKNIIQSSYLYFWITLHVLTSKCRYIHV